MNDKGISQMGYRQIIIAVIFTCSILSCAVDADEERKVRDISVDTPPAQQFCVKK